jgi:hypothetical protein
MLSKLYNLKCICSAHKNEQNENKCNDYRESIELKRFINEKVDGEHKR